MSKKKDLGLKSKNFSLVMVKPLQNQTKKNSHSVFPKRNAPVNFGKPGLSQMEIFIPTKKICRKQHFLVNSMPRYTGICKEDFNMHIGTRNHLLVPEVSDLTQRFMSSLLIQCPITSHCMSILKSKPDSYGTLYIDPLKSRKLKYSEKLCVQDYVLSGSKDYNHICECDRLYPLIMLVMTFHSPQIRTIYFLRGKNRKCFAYKNLYSFALLLPSFHSTLVEADRSSDSFPNDFMIPYGIIHTADS